MKKATPNGMAVVPTDYDGVGLIDGVVFRLDRLKGSSCKDGPFFIFDLLSDYRFSWKRNRSMELRIPLDKMIVKDDDYLQIEASRGAKMAVMEAEPVINLRALRNEADWLPRPASLGSDLMAVRKALLDANVPPDRVGGIIAWLLAKAMGEEDTTTEKTRSRYRHVLAGLESPLPSELRSDSPDQPFPVAA